MSPGIVRIRLDKRDYSTSCAREQLGAGPARSALLPPAAVAASWGCKI